MLGSNFKRSVWGLGLIGFAWICLLGHAAEISTTRIKATDAQFGTMSSARADIVQANISSATIEHLNFSTISGTLTGIGSFASINSTAYVSAYASLNAAVTAIGSTPTRLVIDEATTVTSNLVIPTTIELDIPRQGSISHSTYTITFSGHYIAARHQAFSGTGLVSGLALAYPSQFGTISAVADSNAAIQKAINAAQKTIIDQDMGVSSPLELDNGKAFEIAAGYTLSALSDFSGDAILDAPAGTLLSDMQDVVISGAGVLNGASYADRGIYFRQGRQSKILGLSITGCNLSGIVVGDPAATYASYEITTSGVTVRNTSGVTNDPSSIGVYYDNATDSVIDNVVVVGYRTGLRNDGGSIVYRAAHPWTLTTYGPMVYGIYVAGGHTRLESCYADSPTNAGDALITDVYGYFIDAYNAHLIGCSGYLNSIAATDNIATGIYFNKSGPYSTVIGGHFSGSSSYKWKALIGGYYTTATNILAVTSDGNYYANGADNRLQNTSLTVLDDGTFNLITGTSGVTQTGYFVANGRGRFGYDGDASRVRIDDASTDKPIAFYSNDVESLRLDDEGIVYLNAPVFENNSSAVAAGKAVGRVYRNAKGDLKIVR